MNRDDRAEKVGGGRRDKKWKEDTSRYGGCQLRNTLGEAAASSIAAMQQFGQASNDESSDKEERR